VVGARYDGHADWYDSTFRYLRDEAGSSGLLARLLGPADGGDPVCLDVGCGTALHFEAVAADGYRVIGVDLSADQLRIAASRNHRVVRADAARLPAARVLRPGGRLVYLGMHPAYVGAFIDRRAEVGDQQVRIGVGYGDERLRRDPTGRFPVRGRVGARYLTLQTVLGAFLAQDRLRLSSFVELDTNMQPWRAEPSDGRVVPWNIAIVARAATPSGA
jgi:SAM-dependent methyltransferase